MKLYKNLASALKERENVLSLKITISGQDFLEEIFNFPYLQELYLDGNCKNFPAKIQGLQELKILSLKWNQFKGDLSPIFHLPKLENIKIIDTPMKSLLLPLGFSVAPIKSLTIKNCGLKILPEEISILSELTELYLSGNELHALPLAIVDLKKLKRMNLDQNHFSQFPDYVKKNSSLTHLSMDQNDFSDDEKDRIQREFNLVVQ
jgi:Leucine-rich repeat (LRR) protein